MNLRVSKFTLKQQQSQERKRLLQIRREYLDHMFHEQIKHLQLRYFELHQRVHKAERPRKLLAESGNRARGKLGG